MDGIMALGRNVRRMRQERQLSLGSLALQAGVAKQTLANLEGGTGNPTVETVLAVARALGIGGHMLMAEWGSPVLVQLESEAEWAVGAGGRSRTLDEIYGTGQVITAVLELTDARQVHVALPPGTVHHAYVISGTAQAGPVDDARALRPGDFIRFAGDAPHIFRASAGDRAVMHVVTTVPRVQQFTPG